MTETPDAARMPSGSFRSSIRFDPERPVVATVSTERATTVFVVCLEPAQALAQHPAPNELTLLVIDGQPLITVIDEACPTKPGDVLVVASGALHSLRAGSDRAVVVGVLTGRK
ncbi:MAG: cupin domain-containing protein [Actinomycetota bacterium]|nr:cupin domain-containing protein [Actinomycetota bacterium]